MIKLERARSRLYRGRFLPQNTHYLALFEIYKIYTPLHLWNPKWKTAWRKTSRKIPKKRTRQPDPMEKTKRQKLQGKHGTRQKRCGVRRQRDGQRRKTFSCICVYFHVFAIRSMQFLRILNIFMHFETFSCNTKMDERSQRRACKHFHANSKMHTFAPLQTQNIRKKSSNFFSHFCSDFCKHPYFL